MQSEMENKLVDTLLASARDTVAASTTVDDVFFGLDILMKFYAVPDSVAQTFARAAEHAAAGREEQANTLACTCRDDCVRALNDLKERLNNAQVVMAAMEKVIASPFAQR